MAVSKYALRILISIDQFLNTVTGGNPDETISSRIGKAAIRGNRLAHVIERIIDWIFERLTGQAGHCRANIEWDEI